MGEAIAKARQQWPDAIVVHVNGSFHSDYRMGTAQRAKNRLGGQKIAVISFLPAENIDDVDGKKMRKIGDYIVYTLKPPAPPKPPTAVTPPPAAAKPAR
jgi:uncharacterized iron-regulated protein